MLLVCSHQFTVCSLEQCVATKGKAFQPFADRRTAQATGSARNPEPSRTDDLCPGWPAGAVTLGRI